MTAKTTTSWGALQGDVVLRSTLIYGLQELRVYPHLIDHALAWLDKDELTKDTYGQREIDEARRWFIRTPVHVFLARALKEARFPCVAISLVGSAEVRDTLSDVAPEVSEARQDAYRPPLTDPFTPKSYDRATGKLVVPAGVVEYERQDAQGQPQVVQGQVVLTPGQVLVARAGREIPILSVSDTDTCYVAAGLTTELAGCVVKGAAPTHLTRLQCARFTDSYQIGVHTTGESYQACLWLHSLVEFVLLRHRQHLLQERGLDCSQIRSSALEPGNMFRDSPEPIHSRGIAVTGECTKYWVQDVVERPVRTNLTLTLGEAVQAVQAAEEGDGVTFVDVTVV